jgi:hypothetical protein
MVISATQERSFRGDPEPQVERLFVATKAALLVE